MATDTLDNDIYSMIGYYGFKRVHSRLVEIMRDEYRYLHSQFQSIPVVSNSLPPDVQTQIIQAPSEIKKVRKPRSKKVIEPLVKNNNTVSDIPENIFAKFLS